MANYLDENGLQYVWNKIKGKFATIASPAFTGTPTAPTPATSDDSTNIATTAYVNNKIAGLEGATYELTQSATDGHIITLTGSNGDSFTITIPDNDTKYNLATASANGLMSSTQFSKLAGIDSGAQVNVIETVKVNGTALTPTSKAVNVTVPTKTSDLTNNSNFVTDANYVHTDSNYTSAEKTKLAGFSQASDYALKTDISGVYKFKGSKSTYSELPATGNTKGDVWDVQDTGMNYGWTGTAWDALGMTLSISSITNAQIDTICV